MSTVVFIISALSLPFLIVRKIIIIADSENDFMQVGNYFVL